MSTRRSPLALIAAAIVSVCAGGCGAANTVRSGRTLQIALTEYRVMPQDVHAGRGLLTILVHNYGRLTHDLVISRDGVPAVSTKPIAPGRSAILDASLAAGRYVMASSMLSDQALGAYGTLDIGS